MFQFKQFRIDQSHCAMKLGTDSVSLGAWVSIDFEPHCILDIGTGSGILALMMAQRFRMSHVSALEIDESAFQQALENVHNSPWSSRIDVIHQSLQSYVLQDPPKQYHLIVCNPPYFNTGLQSTNPQRAQARHTGSLSFKDLFSGVASLLSIQGVFALVVPSSQKEMVEDYAWSDKLYLNKIGQLQHYPHKPAKRVLLQFSKEKKVLEEAHLIIKSSDNTYTPQYAELTKDFYIKQMSQNSQC